MIQRETDTSKIQTDTWIQEIKNIVHYIYIHNNCSDTKRYCGYRREDKELWTVTLRYLLDS